MLEKVPGISRSDKLRIIQLLEAEVNQVLRIAFARNITRLAKEHEGIISEHQYRRAHKMCMTTVLNKLLTIQLLIQKKVEGIVFDNNANKEKRA
jgi:S-ribosylhomocysteine lyase LuxS involved in autoinducer biosynthesis